MFYTKININGTEYPIAVNISGARAPGTSTAAEVGMFYMDTNTGDVYKCTAVSDGKHNWELIFDKYEISLLKAADERIEAKADAKTRTIVFDTFLNFVDFIGSSNKTTINGEYFYTSQMKNGDVVRILEDDVSDFWYEENPNAEEISYEYDETQYSMAVIGSHTKLGMMRPISGAQGADVDLSGYVKKTDADKATSSLLNQMFNLGSEIDALTNQVNVLDDSVENAHRSANEAKTTANEAKAAADDVGASLSGYVKRTDYAGANAGVVKVNNNNSYGLYCNPNTGLLTVAPATEYYIKVKENSYMPIVPKYLDYAIKVGLTANTETLTDEEKAKAQAWLGIRSQTFAVMESVGEALTVPSGAKPYAQLRELHCAHSRYVCSPTGLEDYVRNYPKSIQTDTGAVLFEMPDDVLSRLPEFGIAGNYLFFEGGKAYYKQTCRVDAYDAEPAEGEQIVEIIVDGGAIIQLAEEIVTDVSDLIPFGGVVNVEGATSLTLEMQASEADVRRLIHQEYNNAYGDGCEYRAPRVKIVFEV